MKRRTFVIIIVVLSLLLVAVPASASTATVNSPAKPLEIPQRFKPFLDDVINTLPEGSHDSFAGLQNQFFCRADGWAADPDDRSLDLNIKIFADEVEVAQTVADAFREDLANAGVCQDGTCSFSVDLWGLISPDADHSITVQAQDAQTGEWVNVSDTPKTLNCFEAQAQTFTVNSTGDTGDAIQANGICETSTPGECTLRAAIQEANANPGMDAISFNIPGEGPYTISPSSGLDFIVDPVIIDGTTQPGFSGAPIIELDGSNAGPDAYGLVIFAGSSTVRGLVINRFALNGIDINVNGGNTIQGNYIGTDITGTLDLGNGVHGISISQGSSENLIGGTEAGAGNLISGNGEFGIIIVNPGSNNNSIQGNFIGTDVTGSADLGNSFIGVLIGAEAKDNVVGGTEAGARNLISGNDAAGVRIDTVGSTGNMVQGNFIGTDVTGTVALGNVDEGVFIGGGASENIIGGMAAGASNLISGNNGNGVTIVDTETTGNKVQGNYIGTNVTGTVSLGNTADGVVLVAPSNTIGGTTSAARNIISGNQGQGIRMQGSEASGNTVQGNFIGLDSTGTIALGNGTDCCHSGVVMHLGASNNIIGGSVPGAGNVISGNTADGVTIMDAGTTGNLVAGNFIGTDATGTKGVANSLNGIDIFDGASDNMVGGITNGAGNTIAFNNANGVVLAMSSGTGNAILSNSIHSNSALGIDLGDDGVTLNDLFDADSGPNNLQNFPVLIKTVESRKKGTLLHGALITTGNTTLRIEFFSSDACDASGYGEGQTYLGFTEVKANPTGLAKFKFTLPTSLANGASITATTTDAANNTSEFSQCMQVTP